MRNVVLSSGLVMMSDLARTARADAVLVEAVLAKPDVVEVVALLGTGLVLERHVHVNSDVRHVRPSAADAASDQQAGIIAGALARAVVAEVRVAQRAEVALRLIIVAGALGVGLTDAQLGVRVQAPARTK